MRTRCPYRSRPGPGAVSRLCAQSAGRVGRIMPCAGSHGTGSAVLPGTTPLPMTTGGDRAAVPVAEKTPGSRTPGIEWRALSARPSCRHAPTRHHGGAASSWRGEVRSRMEIGSRTVIRSGGTGRPPPPVSPARCRRAGCCPMRARTRGQPVHGTVEVVPVTEVRPRPHPERCRGRLRRHPPGSHSMQGGVASLEAGAGMRAACVAATRVRARMACHRSSDPGPDCAGSRGRRPRNHAAGSG